LQREFEGFTKEHDLLPGRRVPPGPSSGWIAPGTNPEKLNPKRLNPRNKEPGSGVLEVPVYENPGWSFI
jgi:hypothetical protein